jgi:GH18 family chitinase
MNKVDNRSGQYIFGRDPGGTYNGWKPADDTTRQMLRNGGWNEYSSAGVLNRVYFGAVLQGGVSAGSQCYYQKESGGAAINYTFTDLPNEARQVFGDATNGNFDNRGRISTESLRASDDLIFLNVHPNKDGSLSFENPRVFQGKGVTTWEGLIKSVRAKVKGTKVKIRLGASSGEWKAMVADEAARTTFAKNIKTVLEKNKLDGIDLDFEWAENEKEYKDYSLAILKMREVLGDKYLFSVSLHPVCYKISKEAIEAVDFISLQCYGPSPVRFPIEKYCSDIQMVLEYGIPKEKLVAGVPFYGVTKDNSKKTEAYFNFVQNGLVTSPAQNEVIYQGDTYVFDGQDNIRIKTRYAKEQKLKGMMSWDLATDLPLNDSKSLLKTMTEELRK